LRLYEQATGWLGWTPDVALHATAGEITAALDGKISFIRASNGQEPWPEKAPKQRPNVAAKMKAWLAGVKAAQEAKGVVKDGD
jgi:hypothetical protein